MSEILKGNRVTGKLRAPRSQEGERLCGHRGCPTRLSRYNSREFCYAHAPTRFPRLRGRVVRET
jgi:hypothetical protein